MSTAQVVSIHTAGGEHFTVDPWERIKELEAERDEAFRALKHYQTIARLLMEKYA